MKTMGFKLMLLLLVGALTLPMIIPGPNGEPIMSIDDWIPHDFIASLTKAGDKVSGLADDAATAIDGQTLGAGAQIYTWRDERGVLHYSDSPVAGADTLSVPDDGLSMPAKRFIQNGLAPTEQKSASKKARSLLLNDRSSRGYAAEGGKIEKTELESLATGDLSQMSEAMKDLPALLEQVKAARQQAHDK